MQHLRILVKIIVLIVLIYNPVLPQKVIFCKHITATGEPIGQINNSKIHTNEKIAILLKKKDIFIENIIYLHINLREEGSTKNIYSTLLRPSKSQTWLSHNYKFIIEGTYEIHFKDFTHNIIASALLLVTSKEKNILPSTQTLETSPELKVIFCDRVINNKPYRFRQKISFREQNGETYIYLLSNRPLNTEVLQIRVWKQRSANSSYDNFIDQKKYSINPYWYDTFFKYRFDQKGEYKIDFFNEKDLLLKTTYISVQD